MEPNAQFRSAVRGFYAWLGSMVVLGAAPIAAVRLIDRDTLLARAAAVVVGVGGILPWMWVLFRIIQRGDEFVRRMHLIAVAWASAGALILLCAVGWLVQAGFLREPDLLLLWVLFLLLWFVALLGTKLYFERAR